MVLRQITIAVLLLAVLAVGFILGYGSGSVITTITATVTTTATYATTVVETRYITVPTTVTSTRSVSTTVTKTMFLRETTTKTLAETAAEVITYTTTITRTTTIPQEEAYVSPVLDRDYLQALLDYINRASASIHVVMYVAKYDPDEPTDPVNRILNALVRAHQRGVDVKIVVDDETYRSYPQTIEFLKSYGMPIKLDESYSKRTHAKLVIIDSRVVFIGSHNWTESALSYNHEASALIESQEIAEIFEMYFQSIWSNGRAV